MEAKHFSVGIYARLSVDSHSIKNESIDTQIEIAKDYLEQYEEMELFGCYTDLGKTGTNFHREGFQQLMRDIRLRKVNCVIVKDVSRLGRDYIETGNYIEKIFPFLGVRFISVTDHFDSFSPVYGVDNENAKMSMNLRNLVNEMYAKDIAIKVKSAKRAKQEQGSYVGGIPPYGYRAEWEVGRKMLFPEPVTSDIVKDIFRLYDEGKNLKEIVGFLYGKSIHRPTEYRATGHILQEPGEALVQWSRGTIKALLQNPAYIGELVDSQMFSRISKRLKRQAENFCNRMALAKCAPIAENILEGILFCGECGHVMRRISTIKQLTNGSMIRRYAYCCSNTDRIDEFRCKPMYVSQDRLMAILKTTLHRECRLWGVKAKDAEEWKKQESEKAKAKYFKEIQEIDRKAESSRELLSRQYMRYRMGELTREGFKALKAEKEEIMICLEKSRDAVEEKLSAIEQELSQGNYYLRTLLEWEQEQILDGAIVRILVERIAVYSDKRLEITFLFRMHDFY